MSDEITNRVANSKLVTIDLEDYYPKGKRVLLDIKDWLFEGLILKEKEFRAILKQQDWQQHQDCYVALTCTSEAILPSWTYLLVSTYLTPFTKKVIVGTLKELETAIFQAIIEELDISSFKNKPIIIKGCTNKPIPESAYLQLIEKLQPNVTSILFGEACSTVPLYKKEKKPFKK